MIIGAVFGPYCSSIIYHRWYQNQDIAIRRSPDFVNWGLEICGPLHGSPDSMELRILLK